MLTALTYCLMVGIVFPCTLLQFEHLATVRALRRAPIAYSQPAGGMQTSVVPPGRHARACDYPLVGGRRDGDRIVPGAARPQGSMTELWLQLLVVDVGGVEGGGEL